MLVVVVMGLLLAPKQVISDTGPAWALGFINDNYTGSTSNGVAGRYFGADDFLTFSLLALGRLDRLDLELRYQILTSRLFSWRYDLIRGGVSYRFERGHWTATPRLALLLKGNWGGESLQNGYHRFTGVPELHLPYTEGAVAPVLGGRLEYRALLARQPALSWRVGAECELPTAIKPIWVSAGLGGQAAGRHLLLELDGGWRQYLNQSEHYSELVRSGWFGGFRVTVRFRAAAAGGGISLFPARNLENDPLYADKNWNYSPQLWMDFGPRADAFSLRDIVCY
jgi:hypothetical protein